MASSTVKALLTAKRLFWTAFLGIVLLWSWEADAVDTGKEVIRLVRSINDTMTRIEFQLSSINSQLMLMSLSLAAQER